MSYVSCTARLFSVSTDRSIKPTMQDGVGAIPMVAPAPTGASGNRANHVQCTQQRWNLKNRIQFPQWNLELVSLCNAYKLKLTDPKGKSRTIEADAK